MNPGVSWIQINSILNLRFKNKFCIHGPCVYTDLLLILLTNTRAAVKSAPEPEAVWKPAVKARYFGREGGRMELGQRWRRTDNWRRWWHENGEVRSEAEDQRHEKGLILISLMYYRQILVLCLIWSGSTQLQPGLFCVSDGLCPDSPLIHEHIFIVSHNFSGLFEREVLVLGLGLGVVRVQVGVKGRNATRKHAESTRSPPFWDISIQFVRKCKYNSAAVLTVGKVQKAVRILGDFVVKFEAKRFFV